MSSIRMSSATRNLSHLPGFVQQFLKDQPDVDVVVVDVHRAPDFVKGSETGKN